jgi:acyl-CoA synthetase (AMP-forming)/AMP-acid ligase II
MFAAQVEALRTMFDLGPGGVDLQCFAAFALFDVSLGLTSVVPRMDLSRPASADPADLVAAVERFAPDVAFASPVVWQKTSRHCVAHGIRLPSLATVLTVGAPIPPALHRRMRQVLSDRAQVFTPYGATEAMPISSIGTDEVLADTARETALGRGTCVGLPAPGATVRIVPVTDTPMTAWPGELPADTLGEIAVAGEQVSRAYAEEPEADAASKIPDGERLWHRMGDLGRIDARGRLWFCGRKAQRVVLADGAVLAADATEGVFDAHPDVFRTALVGLGPRGSQVPVLCVEMEPGKVFSAAVADELRALARGTEVEDRIVHVVQHPGLPTDARHNSKIRREEVAVWAASQVGR